MGESLGFIEILESIIDDRQRIIVCNALHQDKFILEFLNKKDLIDNILDNPPKDLIEWSPGAISLRTINNPPSLEFLLEKPQNKIPSELAEYSSSLISNWDERTNFECINFHHICLLAFHLRELKILTSNWEFLCEKLENISEVALPTIVCLSGMIPDKLELYIELANPWSHQYHSHLPLYALLSNPQTDDMLTDILRQLFLKLEVDTKIHYLSELVKSRPAVAEQLSKEIITQLKTNSNNQFGVHSWQVRQLSEKINLALLRSINSSMQKNSYWQDILLLSKELQANVIARMAIDKFNLKLNFQKYEKEDKEIIHQINESIDLWKKAIELSPDQPNYIAALQISLTMAGRITEAKDQAVEHEIVEPNEFATIAKNINNTDFHSATSQKNNRDSDKRSLRNHPALLISTAIVMLNLGEIDLSKALSAKAIEIIDNNADLSSLLSPIDLITPFLGLILNLKLHRLCLKLANNIANLNSSNPDILFLLSSIYSALNLHKQAIPHLYSLRLQNPNNHIFVKMYLFTLEAAGMWNMAYKIRHGFNQKNDEQSKTELLNTAYVALKAKQVNETIRICDQILSNSVTDSNDLSKMGTINWLKGLAEIELGNTVSGIDLLYQAKNIEPNSPYPYIALAELFYSLNKEEQAKIILQEAATNIPDSSLIQFKIGIYYLSRSSPSQALDHLESSYNALIQSSPACDLNDQLTYTIPSWEREKGKYEVIKYLCKTCINLGYYDRAFEILSDEFDFVEDELENDIELLYGYAQLLVLLGKSEQAIPYLHKIVVQYPGNLDAQLDLAKVIIQNSDNTKELKYAITLLNSIEKSPYPLSIPASHELNLNTNSPRQREVEVKALQAESFKSIGDYTKAQDAYRSALKLTSPNDSKLKSRLSLGLGNVALELGDIETAIASLQEAIKNDPKNYILLRKLSKAYLTNGLIDSSLQSAISAYQINSTDLENLLWFVDHCLEVYEKSQNSKPEAKSLALHALDQAIEIFPTRADLLIRRGQIETKNNNIENAIKSYIEVANLPNSKSAEMQEAANKLVELGEFDAAIQLYEKALNTPSTTNRSNLDVFSNLSVGSKKGIQSESSPQTDLILELANTYLNTDQKDKAINIIDQELEKEPDNLELNIGKARLLSNLDQAEQAIEYINEILLRNPNNFSLHLIAADLYKSNGMLIQALLHADKAVNLISGSHNSQEPIEACVKAAEIAFQLLLFNKSRKYLSIPEPEDAPDTYKVLMAELSFLLNDLELTEKIVLDHANNDSKDPYWCSVIERYSLRKYGIENSISIPSKNDQVNPKDFYLSSEIIKYIGLCMNAIEHGRWKEGFSLIKNAITNHSDVPIIQYAYIQVLIILEKAQNISDFLDIRSHAPTPENIPADYLNNFSTAIIELEQQLNKYSSSLSSNTVYVQSASSSIGINLQNSQVLDEAIEHLNEIKLIGVAVFRPCVDNAESLRLKIADGCNNPELISAWICAQNTNIKQNTMDQIARLNPTDPEIWVYLSIFQSDHIPELAYKYAKKAFDNKRNKSNSWFVANPILYRLLSKYANMIGQFEIASEYLLKAISIWPNEPFWHFLAAKNILEHKNPASLQAIKHLKEAIKFDSNNPKYYLELAEVYKTQGSVDQAIQALTKATNKIIDDAEIWLSLSKAYYEINVYDKASTCAERVLRTSDDKFQIIEAQILMGQIEIAIDNPENALDYAYKILEYAPDNPSALTLVANAHIKLGQPSKASTALEKAIALTENPYELELQLLNLFQEQTSLENTINKTIELLEKYPQDPNLIAKSAKLLVDAGRGDEAITAAREALKSQTDEIDNKERAKLHNIIGNHLKNQGQLDQAIDQLTQAIKICPDFLDSYIDLGKVYLDRRDYSNASSIFSIAMKQFPDNPLPFYHAGIALKENKDYIQAEKMLRKATELAPTDVSIQRMHGSLVVLNLIHNRRDARSIINI